MNPVQNHKFIILAGDLFNPLGMVRSLGREGIKPVVVLVSDDPYLVNSSKYVSELFIVKTPQEGIELIIRKYGDADDPSFLLTGSDDIVAVIDDNYDRLVSSFYFFNAGKQGRIRELLSKKYQNQLAEECGLNVPPYEEVRRGDMPSIVKFPLITKAVDSTIGNWKDQVFLCRNEAELREAYASIPSEKVLLQQYIEKTNETGFDALTADGGRQVYLPLQLTYFSTSETTFGTSIYFFEPTDRELLDGVRRLMKATGYTGIFSIDFLQGKDGKTYFLEINFRNSGWSYPMTADGINLPLLWARSVLTGKLEVDGVVARKVPFSAVLEIEEFFPALLKGPRQAWKKLKFIRGCDCHMYWDKADQKPFWKAVVRKISTFIAKKIHRTQ